MNYDSLNSETFGEASAGELVLSHVPSPHTHTHHTLVGDWRAGHDAYVRSSSSGPDSTDDEVCIMAGVYPLPPHY